MTDLSREVMIEELYSMAKVEGDEWVKVDGRWVASHCPWMRNVLREFGISRLTDLSYEQLAYADKKWCQGQHFV